MGVPKIFDSGIENLNRKSDLPSPDLFNPGIDIQSHKYGDHVRRNIIQTNKPDTIASRQQFTAKIMYKGRDITVDNVYKINQNFANKFENSASKKVIKVYQVWIPQLNICQRAPTTKGSACVNHGSFGSLNDAGLKTIAEDTKTIQEIKTAYIETYPGVPNVFLDKFPHVGDKVICVATEPTTFEDIKIIGMGEPMAGSTSLKISPRASKPKVGITKEKLAGYAAAAAVAATGGNGNAQEIARSALEKLRQNPTAELTPEENAVIQQAQFGSIIGTSRNTDRFEQTLGSERTALGQPNIVQGATTGDILEEIAAGRY
jgi:hypothetical protein